MNEFLVLCLAALCKVMLPAVFAIAGAGIVASLVQSIFQIQDQALATSAKLAVFVFGAAVFGTSFLAIIGQVFDRAIHLVATAAL